MYSTFKVLIVEDWYEIPAMIFASTVFIDEMTADNNMLLENKIEALSAEMEELRALLEKISSNDEPPV